MLYVLRQLLEYFSVGKRMFFLPPLIALVAIAILFAVFYGSAAAPIIYTLF